MNTKKQKLVVVLSIVHLIVFGTHDVIEVDPIECKVGKHVLFAAEEDSQEVSNWKKYLEENYENYPYSICIDLTNPNINVSLQADRYRNPEVSIPRTSNNFAVDCNIVKAFCSSYDQSRDTEVDVSVMSVPRAISKNHVVVLDPKLPFSTQEALLYKLDWYKFLKKYACISDVRVDIKPEATFVQTDNMRLRFERGDLRGVFATCIPFIKHYGMSSPPALPNLSAICALSSKSYSRPNNHFDDRRRTREQRDDTDNDLDEKPKQGSPEPSDNQDFFSAVRRQHFN
ncbi:MAG: hypothetical protein CL947_02015 [Epsilonproteobacteria bacterium]|nr:hypothetical protein [Campylobacterota bacterium]|tara:strand:- start:1529 stop:2383 length:855 start_codon:yes stop_codon:yes gene_type:complete